MQCFNRFPLKFTLLHIKSFSEQQMFLIHDCVLFSSSNNVANNDINLLIISNNGQSDEISTSILFFLGKQTYQHQTSVLLRKNNLEQ